jgi:chorismate-pyruvate lyase
VSKTFFRSSGYLPDDHIQGSSGYWFDMGGLPPFLRTLLVADGTVTKSLEAYFWEPVDVVPLRQEKIILQENVVGLVVDAGDTALCREVNLMGRQSEKRYACARSYLALGQLPQELAEAMVSGKIGIGELLREKGVETYREIISVDFIQRARSDDALFMPFADDLVSRSYRIRVGGTPAIVVTEYFPVALYS